MFGISAPRDVTLQEVKRQLKKWIKNTVHNPAQVDLVQELKQELTDKRRDCRELLAENDKLGKVIDEYDRRKARELKEKDDEYDELLDKYAEIKEELHNKIWKDRQEMITYLVDECRYKRDSVNQFDNWELRIFLEKEQRKSEVMLFDRPLKLP